MLRHRFAPLFVLAVATFVWGGSFVITWQAVQGVPPLLFIGVRFCTAALLLCLFTRPRLQHVTRTEFKGGVLLALAMLGGYGMQAIGMHLGEASGRAAFISALYVPIVPILQVFILRKPPSVRAVLCLAIALSGLYLLAGKAAAQRGGTADFLVLTGAFAIAAEILLLGHFAPRTAPRRLAVIECACLGCLCLGGTAVSVTALPVLRSGWVEAALFLGLASAGLQVSVNWAQRRVPPVQATLLYTMEPVWAAVFGALAGEAMGARALAGAALILLSQAISAVSADSGA